MVRRQFSHVWSWQRTLFISKGTLFTPALSQDYIHKLVDFPDKVYNPEGAVKQILHVQIMSLLSS